ncbi:MAG: redoxin domain-containing protein [Gemmataceae bacterium]
MMRAIVVLLAALGIPAAAAPPPVVKKAPVADFSLKDNHGKVVSLRLFKDKKAVVLIFTGTQCPIANSFVPDLAALDKEYGPKGVQFLGVNSNTQDSFKEMIEHAERMKIPFPMLKDERNVVADRLGAWRTPEAIVLDGARVIRYQGRISDRFGHEGARPMATRNDLEEAIKEVLAGKEVSTPRTAVSGCYIGRVTKTKKEGDITFVKHIAPLVQKHCQECHRPGAVGPMPLSSYDDVVSWSRMIHEVVRDKRMPPWYAHPDFGKFKNDRSLPEAERNQLLAWIEEGMPRGEGEPPPPRRFPEGWTIGKPDVIIPMPVEFDVPAETPKRGIPYKHYVVETKFDEDKWVIRAEARAGAPEVVHHVLVFVVPPGKAFIPGSPDTPVLTGMAPGEQAFIAADGAAKLVPKGARLIFQLHYTPNGKAQRDRSSIGLIFAKEPPKRKIETQPVFNFLFRIPPGADNHEVESSFTFSKDGYVYGLMPHMHLRGKDFTIRAIYPDKREETLLFVPRFNFNWQGVYRPAEPLKMPKGTKLHCVAHFDNSKGNPLNPDPSVAVTWGDQTWQEMMIGWVDFAYDIAEARKR